MARRHHKEPPGNSPPPGASGFTQPERAACRRPSVAPPAAATIPGMKDYVLGTSDHELERLALQQRVWGPTTARFLDRLELSPGARVLDVGCGPGFVVEMLRERVAPGGEVLGVDASPKWIEHLRARIRSQGWSEVRTLQADINTLELEGGYDVVFLRWVLSFLPERARVVRRLAELLVPGGRLAVMDYNHEGISVFPRSAGFEAVVRATRRLYAQSGGDTWVMGSIASLFRSAGLRPTVFEPVVIGGGPDSPAFRWADAFFPYHSQPMVEQGVLTAAERELFLREWEERKVDPDALFFSPIVVGAVGRKP